MPFLRQFFSHRLIWLALLVSLGIGALFARTIWTIRADEWNYAAQTNANLARTLEQGLSWALDTFDKSLEGVAREVGRPEVWALPPDLRARVVFDNSLRARGAGDVLVLDTLGNVVLDSGPLPPRRVNFADRDYFTAFQSGGHQGLFVGKPVPSRVTGLNILPVSRAYYRPDGSFAGVVVGAISLSYFNELFGSLDMGPHSGVNLFRSDGVVITRFPYGDADVGRSLAGTPNMIRFQTEGTGTFIGTSTIDGMERLYSFRPVGRYPLILNVAQSTDTVLAKWYRSAWVLGGFALLLMVSCVGLATLFVRELTLRQQVSARLREAERNTRTILDNMPSMIGYWDAGLRNRFANQVYFEWFGVRPERMPGMHLSDLLGPELFAQNKPFLDRALLGEPQLFERTFADVHGVARHTMASYLPDTEGGKVRGIFVQVTDISERKRMEDELFDEKERVRLTLQSIGDAVVCADAHGAVTYLNPVAERLTGWQAFDAAGHNVDEVVNLRSPDNDAVLASPLRQAMEQGLAVEAVRGVVLHRTSGQRFQVEETSSPITDRHGAVTGAVAVLRDVTESVVMAERMAHLAQYDALTDLPNRVLLQDRAQLAISQARRDGKCLAVMYLDLDGFKDVNDTLGHDVGDLLLVQFAQRLKAAVRASDTVCRQGGDEFVVLLPGLDGAEPACSVACKILASCDLPFELAGRVLQIGLSGGIALYPQHGDTFDALSRHADSAMYAAKRGGRMRFMLYRGPDEAPEVVLADNAGGRVR
ncbi:diguanylate cyclase [Acidovorax sp. sif1233]|uniref:bifunctional diguanylate cyclase/phosphodiesterase n=1 Tax=unclassified Acidovorax TaxID=2684926 RepID=UPI001C476117|nr:MULTISPECIES: diguanylate cyclase [unclassified Acidovorax]MBV7427540.1 diguanylate cyclase [Acidovorax sp. sif0732]MBV7449900.1 diguanylate cyclase [Acidovorax sp. sif0715]MBV7455501.1 diguanylate cyclase [Acidovorax sp. sif1233]